MKRKLTTDCTGTDRMVHESISEHSGQLANLDELQSIVACFPQEIDYAFGYGSGVFAQNHSLEGKDKPMIDLIFSVPNPQSWHEENLRLHPDHYAPLCRTLGSGFITSVQTSGGAGLFFNPLIDSPINDSGNTRQIKYGVIRTSDFKDDLLHWKYLYVAGRLQKPTVHIPLNNSMETLIHSQWQQRNLTSAISTSLLLQASRNKHDMKFNLDHLFETIASLSYMGDPRMKAGAEDPLKIQKLVHSNGQYDRFCGLYQDSLAKFERSL